MNEDDISAEQIAAITAYLELKRHRRASRPLT